MKRFKVFKQDTEENKSTKIHKKEYEKKKKTLLRRDKNERIPINKAEDNDCSCIYIFEDKIHLKSKRPEKRATREKSGNKKLLA